MCGEEGNSRGSNGSSEKHYESSRDSARHYFLQSQSSNYSSSSSYQSAKYSDRRPNYEESS